jgi:hypothetical protein
MAAIDVGVRDAGKDGEVLAVWFDDFEVRGGRVIAARPGRKELAGQQAEVVADPEKAARNRAALRRSHDVEQRQRQGDADATQERPARDPGARCAIALSVSFQHGGSSKDHLN